MWLTAEQEVWLRDSLKDEPEWLQQMVLENFGVCEPDIFGRIPARAALARMAMFSRGYQPVGPQLDPTRVFAPGQRASAVEPPRVPDHDPFGNPRLDTTWE